MYKMYRFVHEFVDPKVPSSEKKREYAKKIQADPMFDIISLLNTDEYGFFTDKE